MKMRSTLILIAAAMAPVYAQNTAAPTPAPQQAVAAPAASALQQRAQKYSAAALLPQDCSASILIPDMALSTYNFIRLSGDNSVSKEDCSEIIPFRSIAFGGTGNLAPFIRALQFQRTSDMKADILALWLQYIKPELKPILQAQADKNATAAKNELTKILPSLAASLPTAYGVAEVNAPEAIGMMQAGIQSMLDDLVKEYSSKEDDFIVEKMAPQDGLLCYKFTLNLQAETLAWLSEEGGISAEDLSKLNGQSFYMMAGAKNEMLLMAVSGDPKNVHFADNPKDSVLNSPEMSFGDNRLGKDMALYSFTSASLSQQLSEDSNIGKEIAQSFSSIFRQLAGRENNAAYGAAAKACTAIGEKISAQQQLLQCQEPCVLQAWIDDQLHIELSGDAGQLRFLPGRQKLATRAAEEKNIFYFECSPAATQGDSEDCKLLPELQSLAQGIAESLNEEDKAQILGILSFAQMLEPELAQLGNASGQMFAALGGGSSIVMDITEENMPKTAIYNGLSNRAALVAGWAAMKKGAGDIIAKLGGDPAMVDSLPINAAVDGETAIYNLAFPSGCDQLQPSISMNNSGICLGSNPDFGQQILNSASGNTALEGAIFSLNFEQLSKCLNKLADEEQKDQEKNTEDDEMSGLQKAASGTAMIADIFDNVKGSYSVQNTRGVLQLDLKVKVQPSNEDTEPTTCNAQ